MGLELEGFPSQKNKTMQPFDINSTMERIAQDSADPTVSMIRIVIFSIRFFTHSI